MAIAAVIDLAGVTAEQHDALVAAMGLAGQPASAVPGLIFHASGPTASGWRVIDIWDSAADMDRFQRERPGNWLRPTSGADTRAPGRGRPAAAKRGPTARPPSDPYES